MRKETYLFIIGVIVAIIGLCIYTTYTKEVALVMSEVRGIKSAESLLEVIDDFITPYKDMMPPEQRAMYETVMGKASDELALEKEQLKGELLFQRVGEFSGLSLLVIGIALMIYGRPKEPLAEKPIKEETKTA